MLDKLKLFNKEKSDRSSKTQVSKRTSSSSGFSSARSERSDSSLSLNDHQNVTSKLLSNSKKSEAISSAKTKTKLLTSSKSTAKESANVKSSKPEKKEKSPARNEIQTNETKSIMPKIAKVTTTKMESKTSKVPSIGAKKLEIRSDSKNNLSQLQQPKPVPVAAVGTNIPKPMAFIKGTTKPPPHTTKAEQAAMELKPEKQMDISNQNISGQETNARNHIIAPVSVENHNSQNSGAHNISQQQHQHALFHNPSNISSLTDSSNSRSTSSAGISNSSDSSIIYRPGIESHHPEFHFPKDTLLHQQQHPQKVFSPNKKPVPLVEANMPTENGHKFHTVPSKMIHGTIFEEEKQSITVVPPMRPLLRGYSSHVTLPTRGTRGQHLVSEYCDDIGQGYCSDGDALRKVPPTTRCSDIENGYMSEGGGGGIHGKHLISIMRARTQLPTTFEER